MVETININDCISEWVVFFIREKPRKYQRDFLHLLSKFKRVCARWCRQTGKTTTVGWYALFKATTIKNLSILIVAPTLRQSGEFFSRICDIVNDSPDLSELVESQSKTEMKFLNGSVIRSLPSGHDGKTIRGLTADIVIIEEAGYMKDSIITSVIMPMIGSKKDKGQIIKIGTPFGKNNFHVSCYSERYAQSFVNYEMALEENVFTAAFIEDMREECTPLEFTTEYEAEFIEDADCYFKTETIQEAIMDYPMIQEVYT